MKDKPGAVIIRPMTMADLPGARRLQLLESWNQTEQDWTLFLSANPDGCFAAVCGGPSDESVTGTITSIRYGSSICWISMLLVDPDWRGRGIGRRLMERAIAANEHTCACLRLDATPAGRPVYERLGFKAEYGVERWIAETPAAAAFSLADTRPLALSSEVLNFDREAFGADRALLLRHLLQECPAGARQTSDGGPGFVLGRRGERYYHIGPLTVENLTASKALLIAGLNAAAGRPVIIDIPGKQTAFKKWIETIGFLPQRKLTRMRRGKALKEHSEFSTAIAGPEYG